GEAPPVGGRLQGLWAWKGHFYLSTDGDGPRHTAKIGASARTSACRPRRRSAMLRVMSAEAARFEAPSRVERLFSRLFGKLLALRLGFPHNYQLEVRGRRSGR